MAKKKQTIYNRPNINKLKTSAKASAAGTKDIVKEVPEDEVEILTPDEEVNVEELENNQEVEVEEVVNAEAEEAAADVKHRSGFQKSEKREKTVSAVNAKPGKAVKKQPKSRFRFKEIVSELKKVSWPKFNKVFKSTCVVITVTAAFLAVLLGMDLLFGWIYGFIPM